MNKIEAIKAMLDGKKVTLEYLANNEDTSHWYFDNKKGFMGYDHERDTLNKYHTNWDDDIYEDGWIIYEEPKKVRNAFHANDEYLDYQAKRIAELEEKIKSLDFQYEELMKRRKEVRELERQNVLYKKFLDSMKDQDESVGGNWVLTRNAKRARETQRMIDAH